MRCRGACGRIRDVPPPPLPAPPHRWPWPCTAILLRHYWRSLKSNPLMLVPCRLVRPGLSLPRAPLAKPGLGETVVGYTVITPANACDSSAQGKECGDDCVCNLKMEVREDQRCAVLGMHAVTGPCGTHALAANAMISDVSLHQCFGCSEV